MCFFRLFFLGGGGGGGWGGSAAKKKIIGFGEVYKGYHCFRDMIIIGDIK